MKIYLIDGTYELFRAYYGAPKRSNESGMEVGAVVALLRTLFSLLRRHNASHLACAFDHVIESFRNNLFDGYKTGDGIEAELKQQFVLAEEAVQSLGIVVWPMVDFEADDALATAALRWQKNELVEQVVVCSPDKDLAQCVRGTQVVCFDRRRDQILDERGVVAKFGVSPKSMTDWLALVGDKADGIPGIPGWGPKSTSAVLSYYHHLEKIPKKAESWDIKVPRAVSLAENLATQYEKAFLYRDLTTLREDVPLKETLEDLEWKGPRAELKSFCCRIGAPNLLGQVPSVLTNTTREI